MSTSSGMLAELQDPTYTAALNALGPDAHTSKRLHSADAEHLYLTTRRCFVGPIPEGWLKSHRKEWYKHYLGIHHASKAPTFTAAEGVVHQRRLTGIDGPRVKPSFPQPGDAVDESEVGGDATQDERDEEGDVRDDASDLEATHEAPIAIAKSISAPSNKPDQEPLASFKSAPSQPIFSQSPSSRVKSPTAMSKSSSDRQAQRKGSRSSYVTASSSLHNVTSEAIDEVEAIDNHDGRVSSSTQAVGSSTGGAIGPSPDLSGRQGSTNSLLHNQSSGQGLDGLDDDVPVEQAESNSPRDLMAQLKTNAETSVVKGSGFAEQQSPERMRTQVRFDVPHLRPKNIELQVRARLAQAGRKHMPRSFTHGRFKDGEIVKMGKMLVRIDIATGNEQPEKDFSEKDGERVETRTKEKWREYMVVCRECNHDEAALTLQMYQTRVIPASNERKSKKHFTHEIQLNRQTCRVNLYSSLDKSIVIWQPKAARSTLFFLRTQTGVDAVEWYHFLREILGYQRGRTIQVNIPDLSVSVRLDNPFENPGRFELLAKAADGDEEALEQLDRESSAVAFSIIGRCIEMLMEGGEWRDVLNAWLRCGHVGLAWKRYDRIEWIHGANERRMYGAMAMLRSHELELRAKQHYPLITKTRKGKELTEPPPVEGFLIRLTSQKGVTHRMGKMFFKRLYFTTQNQYLVFVRPAKATPPTPPQTQIHAVSDLPSAKQIASDIPIIYAVNPYPFDNGNITWLTDEGAQGKSRDDLRQYDIDAADEAERNGNMMLNCDGFIDLCDVIKVRKVHLGAAPEDADLEEGSDVDFHLDVTDSHDDDGTTTEMDHDRTLELVMRNGLVVRLQAYNKATKQEWMKRLRDLAKYWRLRSTADMNLFKSVRQQNLKALNIDERAEAHVGSFAQKWEVTKSFASPELYNMCGMSSCRTIHKSGILFRKPRKHSTFTKCHVILAQGHLLVFQDTLRTSTGKMMTHIHHDRIASIDLKDCYLYSGSLTETELLSQNRTFDSNDPSSHALPRVFPGDGWTSTDGDAMTCFVVWHSQHKGWFRAKSEVDDVREGEKAKTGQKLRRVNQLGVKGRSIVFKARSRAEKDHWVLSIAAEIERLAHKEDVRVVGEEGAEVAK